MADARSRGAGEGPRPDPSRSGDRRRPGLRQVRGGSLDSGQAHPRARRRRAPGPLRRREVRRAGPLADRLRARLRDLHAHRRHPFDRPRRPSVDRLQGDRAVRLRRAEGALPPGPLHRQEARRFRADRAQGRLRRLQHRVARRQAGRRLLGLERREALYRQRLARRRPHRLRPGGGRRQGPPHRAHPREGDEGLRGRRALRHDGPARERPAAPAASTTSRSPPRT